MAEKNAAGYNTQGPHRKRAPKAVRLARKREEAAARKADRATNPKVKIVPHPSAASVVGAGCPQRYGTSLKYGYQDPRPKPSPVVPMAGVSSVTPTPKPRVSAVRRKINALHGAAAVLAALALAHGRPVGE